MRGKEERRRYVERKRGEKSKNTIFNRKPKPLSGITGNITVSYPIICNQTYCEKTIS